jgi:hypothetical protein
MASKAIIGAGAALLALLAGPAAAEPTTRIHIVYKIYYERVRPGQAAGPVREEMTLLLTGKNQVREDYQGTAQGESQSWLTSATLGGGKWSVAGPNKLVRVLRRTQSVRTDTVVVNGKSCQANARFERLPGFSEYEAYSVVLRSMAYYSQIRLMDASCDIQSQ